ncbi:sugar/nucleoside kinase (ribokinase family) [Agrobacterium vitis]|nr:sugar/nucleoside kinase (ribokinase family) [Agrobacterium vitis]MBE1437575.1 sugar/nucleoside kinase (ribokinase family) [Agrobacterium vitis]
MEIDILVLGGAHIDRRGRIDGETTPGASNPGQWIEEPGGGGLNAARSLARLGLKVTMVSPRGGDALGQRVAEAAIEAGINDQPFTFLDRATPSYTAILERDGNLVIALADMELYRLFTPRRLKVRALRETVMAANAILVDANLPRETLEAASLQAQALGKTIIGIGISPAKVVRYRNCLRSMDYLFMNAAEARAITEVSPEDPAQWPSLLRNIGLKGGVITNGSGPVIAFDDSGDHALTPPKMTTLVDVTGAGDSLCAGAVSQLTKGNSLAQALRHGVALAGLTLLSPHATAEDLTPERLAAHLDAIPEPHALTR